MEHPEVRTELLCKVPLACILPPGHRLASKREIQPKDLAGERFASFRHDSSVRRGIDRVFDQAKVKRTVALEAPMAPSICAFVARGIRSMSARSRRRWWCGPSSRASSRPSTSRSAGDAACRCWPRHSRRLRGRSRRKPRLRRECSRSRMADLHNLWLWALAKLTFDRPRRALSL
jgi:hypothetical protein